MENFMKNRISVITLGVAELEKSVAFYSEGMGFHTEGIIGTEFENGAVAFFDMQSGLKLALWPRTSIAADTGLSAQAGGALEFTLGHNVSSKDDVDAAMLRAKKAGARIVKTATETFYGGYAGYFQDPDEHLWEVVFNPHLLPND
jgi:catechol 2,3-dioxygenase-like lactoylglutathione lyase family enzyme